jgi:1-deoxy-D-xylulose-5-phosphate reductoisomerase
LNRKRIGIIGSTGSIGKSTIEVLKNLKKNNFDVEVVFLSANTNITLLAEQVKELSPRCVYIENPGKANEFKNNYDFKNLKVITGFENLLELVRSNDYDMLLAAVVGFYGLAPIEEAIKSGKQIAVANKEPLVVAGKIINSLLKEFNSTLLPIDSEHSAILQCLSGEERNEINKIILTASGGPFRNKSIQEIENSSLEDALNHPNWSMGDKITIDSATMMNKGLEVIEAKWLFDIDVEKIDVIIHPQSIIHSMVEFTDGSIKAQLGIPDMKIPIQYAITYPERVASDYSRVDFTRYSNLTFEKPDLIKFECLRLAFDAIKGGGTYPVVLNASNEIAVELYLKGKIKFLQISKIIKFMLDKHNSIDDFEMEHIYEIDRNTRKEILEKQSWNL